MNEELTPAFLRAEAISLTPPEIEIDEDEHPERYVNEDEAFDRWNEER